MLVLMGGGTASGKTSIATEYAVRIDALLIHHDRYYKDIPHPLGYNFDEPDALDNTLLAEHMALLRAGLPANLPKYDFPSHSRLPETEIVYPKPIIIIEGILVLAIPELVQYADICVFVDAPSDIRLCRRLNRDVLERQRSIESVLAQYLNTVRPMHNLHIEPSKSRAHVQLDGTVPIEQSVRELSDFVSGFQNKQNSRSNIDKY